MGRRKKENSVVDVKGVRIGDSTCMLKVTPKEGEPYFVPAGIGLVIEDDECIVEPIDYQDTHKSYRLLQSGCVVGN